MLVMLFVLVLWLFLSNWDVVSTLEFNLFLGFLFLHWDSLWGSLNLGYRGRWSGWRLGERFSFWLSSWLVSFSFFVVVGRVMLLGLMVLVVFVAMMSMFLMVVILFFVMVLLMSMLMLIINCHHFVSTANNSTIDELLGSILVMVETIIHKWCLSSSNGLIFLLLFNRFCFILLLFLKFLLLLFFTISDALSSLFNLSIVINIFLKGGHIIVFLLWFDLSHVVGTVDLLASIVLFASILVVIEAVRHELSFALGDSLCFSSFSSLFSLLLSSCLGVFS